MKVFCISYDLRENRNYDAITNELNRLGGIRVLESVWTLKLNDDITSEELRDHLGKFTDSDDGIFVATLNAWATRNVLNTPHNFK